MGWSTLHQSDTLGLVNIRSWCKIQKCSRRLCPNSRASYIAMVVPVGGLAPTGTLGPPPEEVLRLLPALKATVVALTVMVIGEFIATYYQEAISELLTPLLGLIALRDASQTGQCILCLALVAGFNCISDITSLVLILSGERYIAGAKYFFSTECSGKVRVYDPTTQSMKVEVRELCSWQTVLGNSVLICALILEFLCCKWSIKAFRAYQADNLNAMDAMLGDAERMDRMDRMDRMGPGHTPMAEGEDRSRPPASAAQGFVPFSGQGQRLSWRMPRAVKKSEGIAGIACGGNLCENSVTLSLFARNIFSCKLRQNWSWMLQAISFKWLELSWHCHGLSWSTSMRVVQTCSTIAADFISQKPHKTGHLNMSWPFFYPLFPKVPDFLLAKVQKSLLMKQQPQNEQQAIPGHCFLSTRMAMDGARSGIGVLESAGEKRRGGAWSIRGCLVVNEQVFFSL